MSRLSWILRALDTVPAQVWAPMTLAALVTALVVLPVARRRLRKAGQLLAQAQAGQQSAGTAKERALLIASLVPAAIFWLMVLAGSFRNLSAFGRNTLNWHDGWEYLVPCTLDGVAVGFGVLAFRAVDKQRAPDRAYRVVWGATVASAIINFGSEYGATKSVLGGGYLALLSLFGMVMFHEFLDQFTEGTAYVKRAYPKFGLRWVTWPTNTFCAAVAWRNYPPEEGTEANVRNAVANLERVRGMKARCRKDTTTARHMDAMEARQRAAELAAAKRPAGSSPNTTAGTGRHEAPGSGQDGQRAADAGTRAPARRTVVPITEAGSNGRGGQLPAAPTVEQLADTLDRHHRGQRIGRPTALLTLRRVHGSCGKDRADEAKDLHNARIGGRDSADEEDRRGLSLATGTDGLAALSVAAGTDESEQA